VTWKGNVIMKFKSLAITFLMLILICTPTTVVMAAPENADDYYQYIEDYVNDYFDDDYNSGGTSSGAEAEPTQPDVSTEPVEPTASPKPTEPPYIPTTNPPATEPPYVEPTQEPTYEGDADVTQPYWEQPTQRETEAFTDKPTQPRSSSLGDTSGNVALGIGLWVSIIIGVIVVSGIMVATHKRKKG